MMNNLTIDGADINDPSFNVPPGNLAGVQLGVDAMQEFGVVVNPYSAQYGRNAGANVLYITRSGTNFFHGSAYGFLRNASLDAADYFDIRETLLRSLPVWRNLRWTSHFRQDILFHKL